MALFAKSEDRLVDAWDAEPSTRYTCAECSSPVKVRRPLHKFPHFYHIQSTPSCRLYSKSETHLLIQLSLQKKLPGALLEKRFPQIGRIADIVWEKRKIIFEVQCSLICVKEAMDRMREYESLGYTVVWVLDDRIFNNWQLRPGEKTLRSARSIFVHAASMHFYQQNEVFLEERRLQKGSKETVRFETDPFKPLKRESEPTPKPPFKQRLWRTLTQMYRLLQRMCR